MGGGKVPSHGKVSAENGRIPMSRQVVSRLRRSDPAPAPLRVHLNEILASDGRTETTAHADITPDGAAGGRGAMGG